MIQELKCWPEPFQAVWDGTKRFEFRKDDREFAVGDLLRLREWDPAIQKLTGRYLQMRVTYLLRGPAFGIPEGYCCMSLNQISQCGGGYFE